MYKMYNTQLDEESDDDKNSLNSSFWSDGEKQEDEEEEEVERVTDEEASRPVAQAEDSLQEASEEEKPELFIQGDVHRESLEHETHNDEECSSCSDSPAPSLMTSGYGTYRPEEQEGGGCGDDHTMTEFDQDSRGDLSETRDDEEDDRSLCSFGGFDTETTREPDYHETRPPSVSTDDRPEASMKYNEDLNPEEDMSQADKQKVEDELHNESENKDITNATSEEKHHVTEAEDKFFLNKKHWEGESDPEEGKQHETLEEVQKDLKEQSNVESEDPDESSSNRDIKFIDSKVDYSWMTYKKMCEEWEGNLRQKKGNQFPPATIIDAVPLETASVSGWKVV